MVKFEQCILSQHWRIKFWDQMPKLDNVKKLYNVIKGRKGLYSQHKEMKKVSGRIQCNTVAKQLCCSDLNII